MAVISKKVCLIGDFGVGKTSLIRQFVDRQFSDQYLSTVGVKISRKAIHGLRNALQESQEVQLLIWDIEGNTKFKAISATYLQGASGVIIVSDVTRPETIDRLPSHIQDFLAINPRGSIMIALNKSDLIAPDDLEKLLQHPYFEQATVLGAYATSAKIGENVNQIFELLAQSLIQS